MLNSAREETTGTLKKGGHQREDRYRKLQGIPKTLRDARETRDKKDQ